MIDWAQIFARTEEANRERILGYLDPNPRATLLDLGCGDGVFTLRLMGRLDISFAAGVEIVPELARGATLRGIDATEADLNGELPYRDCSFDVIHANQVIEHLHNTDLFLREIHRILRPTGYVIISTNNLASWHNIASLVFGYQPMACHLSNDVLVGNPLDPLRGMRHCNAAQSHLRIAAYRGLRDLLQHHGLGIVCYGTVGYYPLTGRAARVAAFLDPVHGVYLTCKVYKQQQPRAADVSSGTTHSSCRTHGGGAEPPVCDGMEGDNT